MPLPEVITTRIDNSVIPQFNQKYKTFFAGYFTRGPVEEATPVYSIVDFKEKFGKPGINNLEEWYTIYNYFEYQNDEIIISRVVSENSRNSYFTFPKTDLNMNISRLEEFGSNANALVTVVSRNPGSWSNGVKVAIFGYREVLDNVIIHLNFRAKDFVRVLAEYQKYLVIFHNSNVVESTLIENNDYTKLNLESNYIYIENKTKTQAFYGDNIINLTGGYSNPPDPSAIARTYLDLGDSKDLDVKFVIANPYSKNTAIELADIRQDCLAFINVKTKDEVLSLTKSERAVVYLGEKIQTDIYTNKPVIIGFSGDIVGLRCYLSNNQGIEVSHCKPANNLLNTTKLTRVLTQAEIQDLYDNNINVVKKGFSGFYPFSENTLKGTKITNELIYQEMVKVCSDMVNYYIFEQNDQFTRSDLSSRLRNILETYKARGLIQDFKVICDESNNPVNSNEINVSIYYKPVFLIEVVRLNLIATNVI